MTHIENNNLEYNVQHGLESKYSCECQFIELTRNLIVLTITQQQMNVNITDFPKAFDNFNHKRLVLTLLRLSKEKHTVDICAPLSNHIQSIFPDGINANAC